MDGDSELNFIMSAIAYPLILALSPFLSSEPVPQPSEVIIMVDLSGSFTGSEFAEVQVFCRQFLSTLQPSLAFNGSHFSVRGYGSLGIRYLINFTECYSLSTCLAAVDGMAFNSLGTSNIELALSLAKNEFTYQKSISVASAHQVLVMLARGDSGTLSNTATVLATQLKAFGVEIMINAIGSVQTSLLTLASEPIASHSFVSYSYSAASQLTYQMQTTFSKGRHMSITEILPFAAMHSRISE